MVTKITMATSTSITSATPDVMDPAKLMSENWEMSLIKVVKYDLKVTKIAMKTSTLITSATPDVMDPAAKVMLEK